MSSEPDSEMQRWIEAGCPEPMAADRDVDGEGCEFDDCDNDAEYRVEWETGYVTVCCQSCSVANNIYAKENDLLDVEVTVDA